MNYKIVSDNQKLLKKLKQIFLNLGYKEAIHIQGVDIWIIDTKNLTNEALKSYKNKDTYSDLLFIKNSFEDITLLLKNSFTNYMDMDFKEEEFKSWCKYFESQKKDEILYLSQNIKIDFKNKIITIKNKEINLAPKEVLLLKELSSFKYIATNDLTNTLKLNSSSSLRSIINRLRAKIPYEIFQQNRSYGYKLIKENYEKENKIDDSYIKDLEEQNLFMQNLVDSSSIFIVTFIHKQLYCINKSFRDYLGSDIIKELWDEENGDFFKLIEHKTSELEKLKENLFKKGKHKIKLYETNNNKTDFDLEVFYFENLDKHLFVFKA